MTEYFPCPWCGSQPLEFMHGEDGGFTDRRFGCVNPGCSVRPYVNCTTIGLQYAIEHWQKMDATKKLREALAECERSRNQDIQRGWPYEDPKAP